MKITTISLIILCITLIANAGETDNTFYYKVDLFTIQDDAFHVTLNSPRLTQEDDIYSFVSYAPGAHQPLNFGRFVKAFRVFDEAGNELITQKYSTNEWKILEPEQVARIEYIIDDTYDINFEEDPIYPMTATNIHEGYAIMNTFGVFGYFENRKSDPIELTIVCHPEWKIGSALHQSEDGVLRADSYYHLADSPILAGRLSTSFKEIGDMKVEAYVFSPNEEINAEKVLEIGEEVFEAADNFIGYSPVDRYTFLMYFHGMADMQSNPILRYSGALEHSYSSTYALPAMPSMLPVLKDVIAHEFMHILTPLNLRSEIIANFDYSKPNTEDRHLWLYEGVTEWVAHYMQLLNESIDATDYLKRISDKINQGNQYECAYSLSKLSTDWSTEEGGKSYGNIYMLGAVTAEALNLRLLELSNGEMGLRQLYLKLIEAYGKERPFSNDDFLAEIVEMTYPEIADFFDHHIEECTAFDYADLFESIGYQYHEELLDADAGPILGLKLSPHENSMYIAGFSNNYVETGLKMGDRIVSLSGVELTHGNMKDLPSLLSDKASGEKYDIVVNRKGEEIALEGTLVDKIIYHTFSEMETVSEEQLAMRAKWLGK